MSFGFHTVSFSYTTTPFSSAVTFLSEPPASKPIRFPSPFKDTGLASVFASGKSLSDTAVKIKSLRYTPRMKSKSKALSPDGE